MSTIEELINRINNYLGNGGLFNPEQMDHEKVRGLLLECRSAFEQIQKFQGREETNLVQVYVIELRKMADQILTPNSRGKHFFSSVADRLELLNEQLRIGDASCDNYIKLWNKSQTELTAANARIAELENRNPDDDEDTGS